MTQDQLNATGYIVKDCSIEAITYQDYLNAYDDENKLFVKPVLQDMYRNVVTSEKITSEEHSNLDDNTDYSYDGECEAGYDIWMRPVNGREFPTDYRNFETEEEANLVIYDRIKWYVEEKNWDAPKFFDSYNEALADLAEGLGRSVKVIERYLSFKEIAEQREYERRAAAAKKIEEHKAWLAIEVPKEADLIVIDQQFIWDLQIAKPMTGKEKSKFIEKAFTYLLGRNELVVKTDFWQLFRIVKEKARNLTALN